jgi:hypothetical protein
MVYWLQIGTANSHIGIATVAYCIPTGHACAAFAVQVQPVNHVLWGIPLSLVPY